MNSFNTALRWAALAAFALTTTAAQAASFDFNWTGSFGSTTTLGGTALGAETPFSLTATFDGSPSANLNAIGNGFGNGSGYGIYPITAFTLIITGRGTYTSTPISSINVRLGDLGVGFHYDTSQYVSGDYVGAFYTSNSNNGFDFHAPSDNVWSSQTGVFGAVFAPTGYNIPLVGVTGGLSIRSLGSSSTASVTAAAVPEPAEYAAVTGLALGVFALVQRRRQAAGR